MVFSCLWGVRWQDRDADYWRRRRKLWSKDLIFCQKSIWQNIRSSSLCWNDVNVVYTVHCVVDHMTIKLLSWILSRLWVTFSAELHPSWHFPSYVAPPPLFMSSDTKADSFALLPCETLVGFGVNGMWKQPSPLNWIKRTVWNCPGLPPRTHLQKYDFYHRRNLSN